MLKFSIFHEWNILVMTSNFSKNGIYWSTIVEITDCRTWKQNWKQNFDRKLVYILGKTVQDMVFWTFTSGKQLVVRWRLSDAFNVIFEINRHLYLVFLLLTLGIVFFGWVRCEQSYITATYCLSETRLLLKLLLGFSAESIRTRLNGI